MSTLSRRNDEDRSPAIYGRQRLSCADAQRRIRHEAGRAATGRRAGQVRAPASHFILHEIAGFLNGSD